MLVVDKAEAGITDGEEDEGQLKGTDEKEGSEESHPQLLYAVPPNPLLSPKSKASPPNATPLPYPPPLQLPARRAQTWSRMRMWTSWCCGRLWSPSWGMWITVQTKGGGKETGGTYATQQLGRVSRVRCSGG